MDRDAWWAADYRVAKSRARLKRLSMHALLFRFFFLIGDYKTLVRVTRY